MISLRAKCATATGSEQTWRKGNDCGLAVCKSDGPYQFREFAHR